MNVKPICSRTWWRDNAERHTIGDRIGMGLAITAGFVIGVALAGGPLIWGLVFSVTFGVVYALDRARRHYRQRRGRTE